MADFVVNNNLESANLSSRKIYPTDSVPSCENCVKNIYFNFKCSKCLSILNDDNTSISQLLAIARQWDPDIQCNMDLLIQKMLEKGAHPDDRDQLTDMTLLHFASKSGAEGVGDQEKSLKLVMFLIEKYQADPNLFCKWNDMNALHFAVYFDVASVVGYLVTVVQSFLIDHPSKYLNSQTPLHIAAANLSLKSARILLSSGANILLKDDQMRTPLDCVPDDDLESCFDEDQEHSLQMRTLLEEATLDVSGEPNSPDDECMKTAKVVLSALGLEIGDRVIVGNAKVGTLRYCGPTQFASGIWTGIELDEAIGKNDGSINGIRYFVCSNNFGIFAPINRITKLEKDEYDLMMNQNFDSKQFIKTNGSLSYSCNIMNVHSKIDTGLNALNRHSIDTNLSSSRSSVNFDDISIGSKVYLTDKKTGTVRFIGTTSFATGIWYGIELNRPQGKNDGSVQGVRYFRCEDRYGIFVQFSRIARLIRSKKTNSIVSGPDISESDDSDLSMNISGTSSLDLHQYTQSSGKKFNSLTRSNPKLSIRRSMSTSSSFKNIKINERKQNWLRIGENVLVNGMVGSIRYIGPVHFTEGTFIGIELRDPNGKNNGIINGKRYFNCKPNYGLLVRPNKVTIRGINAATLLPDDISN